MLPMRPDACSLVHLHHRSVACVSTTPTLVADIAVIAVLNVHSVSVQEAAGSKVQGPVMWDASKKAWVPTKSKTASSNRAAVRVPDPAAPVSRDDEGYHTSKLPTLRSEDELAAYQRDLAARAEFSRQDAHANFCCLACWHKQPCTDRAESRQAAASFGIHDKRFRVTQLLTLIFKICSELLSCITLQGSSSGSPGSQC